MRKLPFALVAPLCLAGCITAASEKTPLLGQVPSDSATLSGSYKAVADCSYSRLDQAGLRKTDLQDETLLSLEGGGVRDWELTFRPGHWRQVRLR